MEGLYNILKNEGIEIPDEIRKKINKKISSEYKTISEYNSLKEKINEYDNKMIESDNLKKEYEKIKNSYDEVNKLYENSKINEYKLEVMKSGIDNKFSDFVTSEVMKQVNDEKDFKTALKDYNKENPQYLKSTTQVNLSTNPSNNNKTNVFKPNDLINKFIRGEL